MRKDDISNEADKNFKLSYVVGKKQVLSGGTVVPFRTYGNSGCSLEMPRGISISHLMQRALSSNSSVY